jgi:hypothetical protein
MTYSVDWIKQKYDEGVQLKYIFFWGHTSKNNESVGKFVFSQWFPSPFVVDGVTFKTAEHWMMAQKARLFNDEDSFNKIVAADKPGLVKDLGRQIKGFDEGIWSEEKFRIVKEGNAHKFNQHPNLKDFLLATGVAVIVEASPNDAIWGIGLPQDVPEIENPHRWRGLNLLGFALMEVRDALS